MLENSVTKINKLRAVKDQASHDKVRTGKSLTYEQYQELLLSSAQNYDSQFTDARPTGRSRGTRTVYNHDTDPDQVFNYDIDSDVQDIVEINNSTTFQKGPRLNRDQWTRLPDAAKTAWDLFSPEAKHIILEQKMTGGFQRKGNLHDITIQDLEEMTAAELLSVQFHDAKAANPDDSDHSSDRNKPEPEPDPGPNDSILAHLTKRSAIPPGDIQVCFHHP